MKISIDIDRVDQLVLCFQIFDRNNTLIAGEDIGVVIILWLSTIEIFRCDAADFLIFYGGHLGSVRFLALGILLSFG